MKPGLVEVSCYYVMSTLCLIGFGLVILGAVILGIPLKPSAGFILFVMWVLTRASRRAYKKLQGELP